MSRATRKVGSTGRFGPRYGVSVRRRIGSVEVKPRKWHDCPECTKQRVRRVSTGIYRCRSCGRSRAYIRKFQLCRICFRELASAGKIPGITKASW